MYQPMQPLRSHRIFEALSLLTPHDTQTMQKMRVGARHDGGYVMFDDFANIAAMYSFGIGDQITFDHQIAESDIDVYMFDHTIHGLPFDHPKFHFHRQGLGGSNDEAAGVYTLAHHVARLGHAGVTNLALKIDVEGAEFDALINTPTATLRQFRQLVLEVHWLTRLGDPEYRENFISTFQHINSVFTLCHVHGNNCAPVAFVDGHPVVDVLELTYVRSDLVVAEPSRTVFPTELDYANAHWGSDILLWFYPFLPTQSVSPNDTVYQAFEQSLAHGDQALRAHRARLLGKAAAASVGRAAA